MTEEGAGAEVLGMEQWGRVGLILLDPRGRTRCPPSVCTGAPWPASC